MRSRPRKSFALALAFWLLAPLAPPAAAAQEPAPRAPSRLVLQVEYFKGAPLAYQTVPGGSWFGRFALVPTPRPRAAADTVLAVDVKTRLDGERAEMVVKRHRLAPAENGFRDWLKAKRERFEQWLSRL